MLSLCITDTSVAVSYIMNIKIVAMEARQGVLCVVAVECVKHTLGLRVKCPVFLSDYNQICFFFSAEFRRNPQYQIRRQSVQW